VRGFCTAHYSSLFIIVWYLYHFLTFSHSLNTWISLIL
jgi:hypothetical protein